MRDMLFARLFGAGLAADAFQLAFTLPNTFRRLFAEGAFSVAFVPMYGKKLHGEGDAGEAEAGIFANDVLSVFVWVLFGFSILCILGMEGIVWLLAREYQLFRASSNSRSRWRGSPFPISAGQRGRAAVGHPQHPLALRAGGVRAGIVQPRADRRPAVGLGVRLYRPAQGLRAELGRCRSAGILQLVYLLISLRRAGVGLRLHWPRLTPDTKVLLWRIFPATFGAGIYQISQLADTFFATSLPQGSLTLLKMGDRLNQMPLGIVGIALGTAILPALSRHIAGGDPHGAARLQGRAIELATFPHLAGRGGAGGMRAGLRQRVLRRRQVHPMRTARS